MSKLDRVTMSNLKKRVRQRNENILMSDIKKSKCVAKGEAYRAPLWWTKEKCPMTDNGKEGVRDYDSLCTKFYKETGARLEIYSKNKGIKDLPIDKINRVIENRLEREQRAKERIAIIQAPSPIINNTTTVVERREGVSPGWIVTGVVGGVIIGGIIGYFIRAQKEKKEKEKSKKED